MRVRTSIVIFAASAAFAAAATAQSTSGKASGSRDGGASPSSASPSFGAMDKNQDGYISRMEAAEGGLTRSFTALDKNNDGRLDAAEFAAQAEKPAERTPEPRAAAPADPPRR
jgi:Ca2+-binding EF-hand superfamily protein